MKVRLLIMMVCWMVGGAFAQTSLSGVVHDASTGAPLAYVNIGMVDANLGTVSGLGGKYELLLPTTLPDTAVLRFSMIGYQSQEFSWGVVRRQAQLIVSLTPSVEQVEEIVVVHCSPQTLERRGNVVDQDPSLWMGFGSDQLGAEVSTKIRLKKRRDNHLKQLYFWVSDHPYDTLFLRINIYAIEKGKPGASLLTENIFVATTVHNGQVVVDLEPYRLIFRESIYLGMEYVRALDRRPSTEDGDNLAFGSSFAGAKSYLRFASQSQWLKTPLLNFGFSVELCEHKTGQQ